MPRATPNNSSSLIDAEQQRLTRLIAPMIQACPDMRQMAREIAQSIIQKQTASSLEPDSVFWHRFKNAQNSSRSFSGWKHEGHPEQSLTLPQLVMNRFNPQDDEGPDELNMMSGFYTADAHASVFNETNEVRLMPSAVLQTFWETDFRTAYVNKLDSFWRDHAEDYRTFAKANFIRKAIEDRAAGRLTAVDMLLVMRAIGINLGEPMTLDVLNARVDIPADVQICTFDVVGHKALDILRIVLHTGRQVLYIPGDAQSFHAFDTDHELHWWLTSRTDQAENRASFMTHFDPNDHTTYAGKTGLHDALDLLFTTWGDNTPSIINRSSHPLTDDAFDFLRDAAKTRMYADLEQSLTSNADLRKQIWIGYLRSFDSVASPLAALYWPIALAAVGAGLAETGLNVDQAITGHTTAQRKEGVKDAIFSMVNVLFNSGFVFQDAGELADAEGSAYLKPEPMPEPVAETAPIVAHEDLQVSSQTHQSSSTEQLLAPFETNVLLDGYEPVQAQGHTQGIYALEDGMNYVDINGAAYAVRYVKELHTWFIIDPQNPFSFYRNLPVRQNPAGVWEPVDAPGLRGGGKFWDKILPARNAMVPPAAEPLHSPYEMPDTLRPQLREVAENPGSKILLGYAFPDEEDMDGLEAFKATREQLSNDADAFFNNLALPARPAIPTVTATTTSKAFIKSVFQNATGLVVGEAHSGLGSKQFFIDNMGALTKRGVKTLYMEHLLTDFHQADLDTFARTGNMPKPLKSYIKNLDAGHRTDPSGRYSFMNLIIEANKHGIRIQSIDCMASYCLEGMPGLSEPRREAMMNFYADSVIRANQIRTGDGRWAALVGNAHANTHRGIAGVADLEGAVGLRVQDVEQGEPAGFDVDPGLHATSGLSPQTLEVKGDVRLLAATLKKRPLREPIEQCLKTIGDFYIERLGTMSELIHRSNDNTLVWTPIEFEGDKVFITRPSWPQVSGRRFDNFAQLSLALKMMGLKQKS